MMVERSMHAQAEVGFLLCLARLYMFLCAEIVDMTILGCQEMLSAVRADQHLLLDAMRAI